MRVHVAAVAVLIAWAVPLAAAAALPAPVTGITAMRQNGAVRVTWQAAGEDTVRYDVYVSRESILGSSGSYDDVESVAAGRTEHVLTELPAETGTLYVSIVAVDSAGAESAFLEEATVMLDGQPLPTQLEMVSASAVSSTGILLTFNVPVAVPREQAAEAFTVTWGSGETLPLKRIVTDGETALLVTRPQVPGRPYVVTAQPVIRGRDAQGTPGLPLNPLTSSLTVLGGVVTEPGVPFPGTSSSSAPSSVPGWQPQPETPPLTDSGVAALLPLLLAGMGVGAHRARRSASARNA